MASLNGLNDTHDVCFDECLEIGENTTDTEEKVMEEATQEVAPVEAVTMERVAVAAACQWVLQADAEAEEGWDAGRVREKQGAEGAGS